MPDTDAIRRVARRPFRFAAVLAAAGLLWPFAAANAQTDNAAESGDTPAAKEHPLAPALRLAKASYEAVANAKDYEAIFNKREVVGKSVSAHTMRIKVRHEPFSVYLWFYQPNEGREVIYVDGENNGNLLVHETGIKAVVGTISLSPTSPQALSESRHPITRIGIANMVKGVVDQWEEEIKYGECDVKYYPMAKLGEVECQVIESSHPQPRKQFKFHMTRLYVDKETKFPVRVEQYGFPTQPGQRPPLLEEYTYSQVKADAGLKDIDFDVSNPKYGF